MFPGLLFSVNPVLPVLSQPAALSQEQPGFNAQNNGIGARIRDGKCRRAQRRDKLGCPGAPPCLLQQSLVEETNLKVQWLKHHVSNAGGVGSISGQGIKSHMPCGAANKEILKSRVGGCCDCRAPLGSVLRPSQDFPGGPGVRTPSFPYKERRFDPWLEN